MTTIAHPKDLLTMIGQDLGTSPWLDVTQQRIDPFADATDDHQWIHVDVERAKTGPFGGPIAHGYLTLSLLIPLWSEILVIEDLDMAVNYGLNKVRFPAPVPAGSRVQVSATLADAEEVAGRHPGDRRRGHAGRGRRQAGLHRPDGPPLLQEGLTMSHAYDAELAPWAPVFAQLSFADIPAARAGEAELLAALPPYDPPVPLDVDELMIPGPEGAPEVRVRRYRPADQSRGAARAGLLPRRRLRGRQRRPVRRRLPPDRRRGRRGCGVRRLPAGPGAPVPGPAGGLLRRAGVGGRARGRARRRPRPHRGRRRERRRRPGRGRRTARPRPWRPAAVPAVPRHPRARRPARDRVDAHPGRHLADHHDRQRRDQLGQLSRGRRARDRPGLAVRRAGAGHRPRRAAAGARDGVRARRASRRGTSPTPSDSWRPGCRPSCRSTPGPSTPAPGCGRSGSARRSWATSSTRCGAGCTRRCPRRSRRWREPWPT